MTDDGIHPDHKSESFTKHATPITNPSSVFRHPSSFRTLNASLESPMKKLAAYGLIFTLGFGACLLLLRAYGTFGIASETEAKRRAIAILDKSPTGTPVADNVIIQAAAKLTPAVVNIDTLSTRRPRAYDFFGNPVQGRPYALEGKGSGVIISPDGYVVTNNHVVEGAQIIRVTLPNGRQFDGRVIGSDRSADLAVVKIDG